MEAFELVDIVPRCRSFVSNRVDVKQDGGINRPCAVVWQLLFLLLEIVGGRLCPVETCVGKKL